MKTVYLFSKDKLQLQIEAQREMEKRFEDRLKIPDADGKKKDESAAAAGEHIFAY